MSFFLKPFANVVSRFRYWRLNYKVNTRNFQEEIDYFKLSFVLTYHHRHFDQISLKRKSKEHVFQEHFDSELEFSKIKKLHFGEQMDLVQRLIGQQIRDMFIFIHETDPTGLNPYPSPISIGKKLQYLDFKRQLYNLDQRRKRDSSTIEDSGSIKHLNSSSSNDPTPEEHEEVVSISRELEKDIYKPGTLIQHPEGFHLQIKKSSIAHPESGYGVFIYGHTLPGTVLAIYPGKVYSGGSSIPEDVRHSNEYLIARYDSMVIDGRGWDELALKAHKDRNLLTYGANLEIVDGLDSLKKFRNPYGIGNYINHPPPGTESNVLCIAYDIPMFEDRYNPFVIPRELRPFIPNIQVTTDKWFPRRNCAACSMVVISIKHLQDEELFLNYRFNPALPYPEWYSQPNLEEAQRRWAPFKLL